LTATHDDSMSLIAPPRLRDGDTIAVCAPAGPINPTRLARGINLLEERFRTQVSADVHIATGFLAGPDVQRADDFNRALRDPDIRAIVVARGGYGVMRILPLLDVDALRADPKPIVGFSDATALLSWAGHAGVRGIHGPVASQLGDLPANDVAWLHRMLTDPTPPGDMPWRLRATGAAATGTRTGWLVGGNLTLIAHLVATPWQIATEDAVLLIEEVAEAPYAIDRYLTRLALADALGGLQAVLVGDLTRCTDPPTPPGALRDDPSASLAVIDERLRSFGIPGLSGAPIGHGQVHTAVPWGGRCALDLDAGTLSILEGAVG
jgi:muramoyltetrapeptide carboxypeptidase